MFFEDFKKIDYKGFLIRDLSIRIYIRDFIKNNISTYEKIEFQDSDTLEILAYDYYGDSELHWVIAMMNDMTDPFYDLPLRPKELMEYTDKKYDDIYGIHHYENEDGDIVDFGGHVNPITNFEFEDMENDKKRKIKILDPAHISQVINELKGLLDG